MDPRDITAIRVFTLYEAELGSIPEPTNGPSNGTYDFWGQSQEQALSTSECRHQIKPNKKQKTKKGNVTLGGDSFALSFPFCLIVLLNIAITPIHT